jgi:hypothetical protein
VCGDGEQNGMEDCEGGDLGGSTCASAGFDAGDLACNDDCTFDTSECLICGTLGEACQSDADCCPGFTCDAFFGDTCWP